MNNKNQIKTLFKGTVWGVVLFVVSYILSSFLNTGFEFSQVYADYCVNECNYGSSQCVDSNRYRICGNYDADPCTEWSDPIYCSSGQSCQNGQCTPTTCKNECSLGEIQRRCSQDSLQERRCGNYDSDPCLEWSQWREIQNCGAEGKICQNLQCVAVPSPRVDLKVNDSDGPITVSYGDNVLLRWISENTSFCQALDDWSGNKNTSGSERVQLNQVKTFIFTLVCSGLNNLKSATDSVVVSVNPKPPQVITIPAVSTN